MDKHIVDFLSDSAARYADSDAFWFRKDRKTSFRVTYAQFAADAFSLASRLRAEGLQGARIALLEPNSYARLVGFFGIMAAGACAVLPDPTATAADHLRLMRQVKCSVCLPCTEATQERAAAWEGEGIRILPAPALFTDEPYVAAPSFALSPDAEAAILFTSGTTGEQKAVVHTQRSVAGFHFADLFKAEKTSVLLSLPLQHMIALETVMTCLRTGQTLAVNQQTKYLLLDILMFQPHLLVAVPAIHKTLMKSVFAHADIQEGLRKTLGGNIHTVISGGGHMDQQTADQLSQAGLTRLSAYGSTESGNIAFGPLTSDPRDVGPRNPNMEVRIADGEITARGMCIAQGYDHGDDPQFTDGWYHTGDLGFLGEDGHLYLTGRKKNLIILSNGKNISPERLEGILGGMDGVEEVQVFGHNDRICAEIFTPGDEAAQEAIRASIHALNKTLPTWEQIHGVFFRSEPFEKTSIGKIKRTAGKR